MHYGQSSLDCGGQRLVSLHGRQCWCIVYDGEHYNLYGVVETSAGVGAIPPGVCWLVRHHTPSAVRVHRFGVARVFLGSATSMLLAISATALIAASLAVTLTPPSPVVRLAAPLLTPLPPPPNHHSA